MSSDQILSSWMIRFSVRRHQPIDPDRNGILAGWPFAFSATESAPSSLVSRSLKSHRRSTFESGLALLLISRMSIGPLRSRLIHRSGWAIQRRLQSSATAHRATRCHVAPPIRHCRLQRASVGEHIVAATTWRISFQGEECTPRRAVEICAEDSCEWTRK
jgi:hypothetical protein